MFLGRVKNKALRWGLYLLIFTVVWYIVTAIVLKSPGRAWDLLAGSASADGASKPFFSYSIAVLGYLIVPVAIAVAFSGTADWAVQRQRGEEGSAARNAEGHLGMPATTPAAAPPDEPA